MKILLTSDTVGGVWTHSLELGGGLVRRGHDVVLATMGPAPSAAQARHAAALGIDLRVSTFKLEWMADPWSDLRRAGAWLLQLERAVSPDVVHLGGYVHAAMPWHVPVVVTAHSCVCTWWRAVHNDSAPPEWDRYREAVRGGLRAADLVVAPTEAMLKAVQASYEPLPHSMVIYNGRDGAQFRPGVKEPLVLSSGRLWDEAKNVGVLGAVAPELSWPVYVAGPAEEPDTPRSPGLRPQMHRLGVLEPRALSRWMGRASIYVTAARYEPFGLSVLEAALSGCALVLSNIPTLCELWGDAAVFVNPDDARSLKRGVEDLIADEQRRTWLADRAHQRARQFTASRMVEAHLAAYRGLLDEAAAAEEERWSATCGS